MISRRMLLTLAPLALFGTALLSSSLAIGDDDPWPALEKSLYGDRAVSDAGAHVQLFAPNQADDAALVPIKVLLAPGIAQSAKSLTLIIDRNPAPVAATFTFGDAYRQGANIGERSLATRVRVDAFGRVRAILETTDGRLLMVSKFVIGSGGCSAPASKDLDQALADLGKARLKQTRDPSRNPAWREAQVMLRHPNYSGLQMNPKTGAFQPARFVNQLAVTQDGEPILTMEGGISISEDPNIRFTFASDHDGKLELRARDTEGAEFGARDEPDPS